jgi:hypothetical protein
VVTSPGKAKSIFTVASSAVLPLLLLLLDIPTAVTTALALAPSAATTNRHVTSLETGDPSVRERVTRAGPGHAGPVGNTTCSIRQPISLSIAADDPEDEDDDDDDGDDDDEEEDVEEEEGEVGRECSKSCSA